MASDELKSVYRLIQYVRACRFFSNAQNTLEKIQPLHVRKTNAMVAVPMVLTHYSQHPQGTVKRSVSVRKTHTYVQGFGKSAPVCPWHTGRCSEDSDCGAGTE